MQPAAARARGSRACFSPARRIQPPETGRTTYRGLDPGRRTADAMELYAILRRKGWTSGAALEEAAARSTRVGDDDMSDQLSWIRSYVLDEGGGAVGTVCIYEAASPEAIREHASRAELPVDEIIPIADTVIVRPDPQPAGA